MNPFPALFRRWTWVMAWRDSRSSRGRLLLFSFSISLGIAALVTLQSLSMFVRRGIALQSKALLGADLVITSRNPLTKEDDEWLSKLGNKTARETSFSTMLTTTNGTRLVNARAMSGPFPFYGKLESLPESASDAFQRDEGVLLEESLLQQFSLHPGDIVRLGKADFPILGALQKVPGENLAFGALAPRVYLPASAIDRTGLLRGISLARHRIYFQLPPTFDTDDWVTVNETELRKRHLETETVAKRQRDLGRGMENLFRFLNLVALVALLLGAIGVASAVQVHLRRKLSSIAILRCLGASLNSTFTIYLAQSLALGAVGSLIGMAMGVVVSLILPTYLRGVSSVTLESRVEGTAVAFGGGVGLCICVVFTLLPLLEIRRIAPLAAIRAAFEPPRRPDGLTWIVRTALGLSIAIFASTQSQRWWEGLAFTAGLAIALGLLAGMARLTMAMARPLVRLRLPFAIRQGMAGLYRPNNRTTLLLVSLGLGTFLMVTLQLTRKVLLQELFPANRTQGANALMFDIQVDQLEAFRTLMSHLELPILNKSAVVTMRLQSVQGIDTDILAKDKAKKLPEWRLRREYRASWRTQLVEREHLVEGSLAIQFIGIPSSSNHVPVSVEADFAKDLHLGLGDVLDFDVQGVPMPCQISSIREVDWRQLRPNFYVIFPNGVLEAAPAMYLVSTRIPNAETNARLQRELGKSFPNISTIDLATVLQTLEGILDKIGLAIRMMAGLTVATGVIVLVGVLVSGRGQRVQESVLLRTLGASRLQVRLILLTEYAVLGFFSALTGTILAVLASWALARFTFEINYAWSPDVIGMALSVVPLLTVTVGLLTSRGVAGQPPLEILRQEGNG